MNTAASSAQQINVLVVIDTDYVKTHYPNPSKDPARPTGIDHHSQYMICTDPRGGIDKQGTADLVFSALPGDYVSYTGVSIYNNSDDAVIVYGINYWKGDNVFNQFVPNLVVRNGAAQPDPTTKNGLPAKPMQQSFSSFDSKVMKAGTEYFYVNFALYTLADGENQQLYGYFYWDPSIQVK
ncbi:inclusion body family protein [Roseateles sp. BYS96W]|uniref:Inclusion body family protein n=1 Tax=Pelomonas nitida TaxID=3299027 RepID=A0ABW7G8N3_9BURK